MKFEIYRFYHGTDAWYATSADRKQVIDAIEYKSIKALQRTDVDDAGVDKSETSISLAYPQSFKNENDRDLFELFVGRVFFGRMQVQIIEVVNNTQYVLFDGFITSPDFDRDAKTLTLSCQNGERDQEQSTNSRKYQRLCPNALYQRHCGLKFEDWAVELEVTAVDGDVIYFDVVPTQMRDEEGLMFDEFDEPVMEVKTVEQNYLALGILKATTEIAIISNTENTLKLYHNAHQIKVSDRVFAAPGCNKSLEMCDERFENHERYGGNPRVIVENPVGSFVMK